MRLQQAFDIVEAVRRVPASETLCALAAPLEGCPVTVHVVIASVFEMSRDRCIDCRPAKHAERANRVANTGRVRLGQFRREMVDRRDGTLDGIGH